MDPSKLEEIGLTKNQSIVYLSLLKLGSATAQKIMKESGLHSSRIYEALNKLEKIGLVGYVVKDYKKYYQAARPKRLLDYLDEKKEAIKHILSELEEIEGTQKEQISASVYKGKEGIKTIHSEMLREGRDVYLIGAKGLIFSELPYFTPNFERERVKRKIKFHLIYDTKEARIFERGIIKRKYFEGKSLPKGFESDSVVNIFGNKVAVVSWNKDYPTAFLIENNDVADSFRKWFRFIYDRI